MTSLLLFTLTLALLTCGESLDSRARPMNIVELANSDPNLLFLSTLIKSGGLSETLSGPGPFTVLAPTNDAFSTLDPNGLLGLANFKTLRKILGYHVIEGAFPPSDLPVGKNVSTLEGYPLEVSYRGGSPWQLVGTYIGPPHANKYDVSRCTKLVGYQSGPSVNASNGVVYIISRVFLPPNTTVPMVPKPNGFFSGCTKHSCIFSQFTKALPGQFPCCIQVDAAPRMPPDIFNDTVVLAEYVRITQQVSSTISGRGNMVNAPCPGPNYQKTGTLQIDWFQGFQLWCMARCGCGGTLHPCRDVPDDPATHTYCSLCGPKYNAPIDLQIMKVKGSGECDITPP